MPLPRQLINMPFTGGVDTKSDPKQVPLGKLLALQNATFQSPGQLKKRFAYSALGTAIEGGGNIANGVACFTRGNELLYADSSFNLYSYDQSRTNWISKGKMPSVTASLQPRGATQYSAVNIDQAQAANGLICTVCELADANAISGFNKGVAYSVYDPGTGAFVVPLTVFDATFQSIRPRVVNLGTNWLIVYAQGTNTAADALFATTLSSTAPTAALPAKTQLTSGTTTLALATGVGAFPIKGYDLKSTGAIAYLAFTNRSATAGTTVFEILSASPTTVTANATLAVTQAINHCVVLDSNGNVVVGYMTAAAVGAVIYTSNLGSQVANPTVDSGLTGLATITGVATAANTISLFYSGGAAGTQYIRTNTLTTASYTAGTAAKLIGSLVIAGQAFIVSGTVYLPTLFSTYGSNYDTQATIFVVDAAANIVAKALPDSAGAPGGGSGILISPSTPFTIPSTIVTGSTALIATTNADRVAFVSTSLAFQYVPTAIAFNFADTVTGYNRAEAAKCVLTSGSLPFMYDGGTPTEMGFLQYPGGTTAAQGAGGGLTTLGVYSYFITYEWMDAQGQIHRSAPGPIVGGNITLTGTNHTITLTIPTLRCTAKTNVLITVWRTIASGSVYFQVNNINLNGTLYNDKTVDTVTWVDSLTDALLSASAQLYTTGGVLADSAPNPIGALVKHRNRIFAIDPTTGQVQYTKQIVPPAPLEFSLFNVMNVDERGGFATAIATMDEKLIIFKQNFIFAVVGQGPDSTGGQNDFQDAQIISADTGCAVPKSVVLTPHGLMFQSPKGYYLLGRDLTVSYIGADVEAFTATCTGAVLQATGNQVRFATASPTANQLVYDYLAHQWSFSTVFGANVPLDDLCLWQNMHTPLIQGVALTEGTGFSESPFFPNMSLTTPWIQIGQIQGFQRIYSFLILAIYRSDHSLVIRLFRDFQSTPFQTDTITTTGATPGDLLQLRIQPSVQKMEALQIQIQETTTGGTRESLWLSGLALEVGVKGGPFRLPASLTSG